MPLTARQSRFVAEFVANGQNATAAARACGYKDPEVTGWRMKQNEAVRAAIESSISTHMTALHKTAEDIIRLLWEQAEPDLALMCDVDVAAGTVRLNPAKAIENGLGHLLKIKQTTDSQGTRITVELADSHAAKTDLGRYFKLFTDRIEHQHDINSLSESELDALLSESSVLSAGTEAGEGTSPAGSA